MPGHPTCPRHRTHQCVLGSARVPLSTFGLDVDTMGMGIVRRQLGWGQRPLVDAIRIEEMVNFYDYTTPAPTTSGDALAMAVEVAARRGT